VEFVCAECGYRDESVPTDDQWDCRHVFLDEGLLAAV
jgi:C4-type Zn-finger protein